ncbi:MAG TPA: SGNH/GDSL hydrolase family protein [Candidatus Didemnitutus sp.]|nr:SGNH/GDSL hydrolase family protein [Candidatus Didemnitutus sp.]
MSALRLLIGLLLITGSAFGAASSSAVSDSAGRGLVKIGASDPRFTYEGRIDFSDPTAPVLIWSGTKVSIDFEGNSLALDFAGGTEQNFFDVSVDGVTTRIGSRTDGLSRVDIAVPHTGERHTLTLFKRSEAASGTIHFTGIEVAAGSAVTKASVPADRPRFEFFGDSIMVGACNEDGTEDQWEDRSTHNNALSYTALTAAAFGADYRCIAVSGIGISIGFVKIVAAQAWDRIYPRADSPRDNLAAWQPDVAFLNYGENDSGFSASHGLAFPADYTERYVALVHTMRAAYPHTHFVLLRGGMSGGANNPKLKAAWEAVVTELEKSDSAVSHYVFKHWSQTHPRVADDRAMADELVAWLKAQPFMKNVSARR